MIDKTNFNIDAFSRAPLASNEPFYDFGFERDIHLTAALSETSIAGCALEFGVYRGHTINIIANRLSDDQVWGFDSFEGLPEDWFLRSTEVVPKWHKGMFSLDTMPYVAKNVTLVKGWFDDSIPTWLEENNTAPIKFLHIDCDLYSSAKTVLTKLNSLIVPGTVIVFDEFYNWRHPESFDLWHQCEYLALKEWVETHNRSFVPLYRNQYMQCSLKVVE